MGVHCIDLASSPVFAESVAALSSAWSLLSSSAHGKAVCAYFLWGGGKR